MLLVGLLPSSEAFMIESNLLHDRIKFLFQGSPFQKQLVYLVGLVYLLGAKKGYTFFRRSPHS